MKEKKFVICSINFQSTYKCTNSCSHLYISAFRVPTSVLNYVSLLSTSYFLWPFLLNVMLKNLNTTHSSLLKLILQSEYPPLSEAGIFLFAIFRHFVSTHHRGDYSFVVSFASIDVHHSLPTVFPWTQCVHTSSIKMLNNQ